MDLNNFDTSSMEKCKKHWYVALIGLFSLIMYSNLLNSYLFQNHSNDNLWLVISTDDIPRCTPCVYSQILNDSKILQHWVLDETDESVINFCGKLVSCIIKKYLF